MLTFSNHISINYPGEIITKWNDIFLTWDPNDYNNITDTRLPWDKVWTPDIVLYNRQGKISLKKLICNWVLFGIHVVSSSAGDGEQGREMRTLIQVSKIDGVSIKVTMLD